MLSIDTDSILCPFTRVSTVTHLNPAGPLDSACILHTHKTRPALDLACFPMDWSSDACLHFSLTPTSTHLNAPCPLDSACMLHTH